LATVIQCVTGISIPGSHLTGTSVPFGDKHMRIDKSFKKIRNNVF